MWPIEMLPNRATARFEVQLLNMKDGNCHCEEYLAGQMQAIEVCMLPTPAEWEEGNM